MGNIMKEIDEITKDSSEEEIDSLIDKIRDVKSNNERIILLNEFNKKINLLNDNSLDTNKTMLNDDETLDIKHRIDGIQFFYSPEKIIEIKNIVKNANNIELDNLLTNKLCSLGLEYPENKKTKKKNSFKLIISIIGLTMAISSSSLAYHLVNTNEYTIEEEKIKSLNSFK